ncbi:helix-turn-helix domain-containing protein [Limosilactobacillus vaginalis]|uniref:helix-turn-helix domain-containing protein n=1 Tax=Limosilactobacillus vaginalis TaxID=1633 RepID=UPI0021B52C3A|nr:helix-turn-helix transcriptional regulator [Limosilactobacillus vaginalis]UXC68612.1 helix-turn-helix domain-containing protein [Limosilactobacillus vaginalis]
MTIMIGDKIRDLRNQKRMSQTELSKILHVSQQTITKWETGKAEPSSSAVTNIANYFNVSADYLLGRKAKKQQKQVDIKNDPIVLSYGGKPVSKEDMEVIKAILARHQN